MFYSRFQEGWLHKHPNNNFSISLHLVDNCNAKPKFPIPCGMKRINHFHPCNKSLITLTTWWYSIKVITFSVMQCLGSSILCCPLLGLLVATGLASRNHWTIELTFDPQKNAAQLSIFELMKEREQSKYLLQALVQWWCTLYYQGAVQTSKVLKQVCGDFSSIVIFLSRCKVTDNIILWLKWEKFDRLLRSEIIINYTPLCELHTQASISTTLQPPLKNIHKHHQIRVA